MNIALWEVGIFLLGLGIFVVCVYFAKLLSKTTDTISNVDRIILNNEKEINSITSNVNDITKNTVNITESLDKQVDEIDASVRSINKATESMANILGDTAEKIITPSIGGINKLILAIINACETKKSTKI